MKRPSDEDLMTVLGAYVDGELTPEEQAEVEAMAAADPAVQAELDVLAALDLDLRDGFDALLAEPAPATLVPPLPDASAQPDNVVTIRRFGFGQIAASLAMLALGAGAGAYATYTYAPRVEVAARGWMADIADYHVVYASQTRHLVEVPASEKDHIEAWLGKTINVDFNVPDLSASGYDFQGARLLVAAGRPVAQLLYTDAAGTVVAICALETDGTEDKGFATRQFDEVQMVRWDRPGAAFVVVGPEDVDLAPLAEAAAIEI